MKGPWIGNRPGHRLMLFMTAGTVTHLLLQNSITTALARMRQELLSNCLRTFLRTRYGTRRHQKLPRKPKPPHFRDICAVGTVYINIVNQFMSEVEVVSINLLYTSGLYGSTGSTDLSLVTPRWDRAMGAPPGAPGVRHHTILTWWSNWHLATFSAAASRLGSLWGLRPHPLRWPVRRLSTERP